MNEYYTYAYLREDGTPYYIGKGKENRAYSNKRKIKPPKDKNRILILKQNLTEKESFNHEIYMIFIFGKKTNGGILYNITDGGEGVSGMKHTDDSKEKIGKAFRGKKLTPEHIEKLRKSKLGNTWNRGRVVPQSQREKIRQTMLGVKHTPERRKNQSLAKLGVKHSPERNSKKSLTNTGKKWYNNGKVNKFCNECPDGFVVGMIKRRQRD
jgi:hypothetical protein